jgi:hypothetical protein
VWNRVGRERSRGREGKKEEGERKRERDKKRELEAFVLKTILTPANFPWRIS